MNRRGFLRGLFGAAASLLGLGAAKAVAAPAKAPLKIREDFGAGRGLLRLNAALMLERLAGGTVRLNRMPEP